MNTSTLDIPLRDCSLELRLNVSDLIYAGCMALNAENWKAFLETCDPKGFRYRITNYSPEIRREQCWMDRDFKGLKGILDLLPRHNSDHSPLTRHATVYRTALDEGSGEIHATTQVAIYRTQLDGMNSHFESGRTSLFAIGRYDDRLRVSTDGRPRLAARTVVLDTRQVDIGSHMPL
jgi:3-phenylpropionate/cinnamic acid dioxygenase small subunit